MTWFSNRGQIVQVACAVLAVLISFMIWFAISPQLIASIFSPSIALSIVSAVVAAFVGYLAGGLFAHKKSSSKTNTDSVAYAVQKTTASVGKRMEFAVAQKHYAIVVHDIVSKDADEPRADIEVVGGTGPLRGGVKTKQSRPGRFLVPISRNTFHLEESCIFAVALFEERIEFFFLNVDHIDSHSKEVVYTICASAPLYG